MSAQPDEPTTSTPATPDEAAVTFALLRAAVATILTTRKDFRATITKRQRAKAYDVVVRIAMTSDETIHLWLEPTRSELRSGVVYLGPNHPSKP